MDVPLVPTSAVMRSLCAALSRHDTAGTDGPIYGGYLALAIATSAPPSRNSVLADFTQASFAGYARVAVSFLGPYDTANGPGLIMDTAASFVATDATTPQTATHLLLCSASTAGILKASAVLPSPIPFADANAGALITANIVLPWDALQGTINTIS